MVCLCDDAPGQPEEQGRGAVTPSDQTALMAIGEAMDVRPGTKLFRQGDAATHIYMVESGVVRISHDLLDGKRQVLAFRWGGDVFGMAAGGRYLNNADALDKGRIQRFQAERLQELLLSRPHMQNRFLLQATAEISLQQHRIILMAKYDVVTKVVAFLLECCGNGQCFDPATQILKLPMSRPDIADYMGVATESVSRALGVLERRKIIHRHDMHHLAIDLPRLRDCARL
ncbi:Crp/Fnr family transcriptional regulator [Komagataeibacter rhaeticus]|uniref:Crp/Fnr family transcriptional regulator n=1 Tax=Komagataeibacter rhaeticus TaxID=215221 RepID=A0A181CCU6_9PROT|nr:Crp/Fnr family transcriptional regulator [Komagataeibacter rhaeticus]QIP36076.1 Crp/Fnr family transcriptional regulator [Komagataeibacter rhaeticus]QOC45837.1 Crp/Fnr family transcriptional regulator [Komagataeibacter rhaeticus]SAY49384.1 Transcriptional activatory protein AadR [Komagataeibacter rhaeticus]